MLTFRTSPLRYLLGSSWGVLDVSLELDRARKVRIWTTPTSASARKPSSQPPELKAWLLGRNRSGTLVLQMYVARDVQRARRRPKASFHYSIDGADWYNPLSTSGWVHLDLSALLLCLMQVGVSPAGRPSLDLAIHNVVLTLGEFKVEGTIFAGLVNLLVSIFKSQLQGLVATAIKDNVASAANTYLNDYFASMSLTVAEQYQHNILRCTTRTRSRVWLKHGFRPSREAWRFVLREVRAPVRGHAQVVRPAALPRGLSLGPLGGPRQRPTDQIPLIDVRSFRLGAGRAILASPTRKHGRRSRDSCLRRALVGGGASRDERGHAFRAERQRYEGTLARASQRMENAMPRWAGRGTSSSLPQQASRPLAPWWRARWSEVNIRPPLREGLAKSVVGRNKTLEIVARREGT